jgi:hypothetical protein
LPALIGALLALGVALLGRVAGFDRERAFYSVALLVIGSYYILFAVIGGATDDLRTELLIYLPFAALAIAGFRTSLWLVAAGLAGHGLFDLFYPTLVAGQGVPQYWPAFCMTYDVVAAACLAALIVWRGNKASVSPPVSPSPYFPATRPSC